MKIEWTTIESGKNKTHSKINTILDNKSKISVFFAENKKHLFWAWISTMAMAFVVTAWQMSWTEFSANVMFPSLTQEITDTNWAEWENQNLESNLLMWDLDLSFDDEEAEQTEENKEDVGIIENTEKNIEKNIKEIWNNSDETEKLINDLFWLEDINEEGVNLLETNFIENKKEDLKLESESELDNLSLFLEDKKNEEVFDKNIEENFHNSAEKNIETAEKKSDNSNIFKQNFNTVDMNLVAQKAKMKNVEIEEVIENNVKTDNLHWSMDSFFDDEMSFSWIENEKIINTDQEDNRYYNQEIVQKTKKLNQTWPEDMIFWLWFLSMILAYFFRRKKNI